jgi:hypothetical protein
VKFLGFVGYAAVLAGDASTGPATLSFNETTGRVELVGSRCVAGMRELKLNVPSVIFPNYIAKVFSAAAEDAEPFCELAIEYWPMVSGDRKEILEKAAEWVKAHPQPVLPAKQAFITVDEVVSPVPPASKLEAVFHKNGNKFLVTFDWTNQIYGVVSKIKNLVPQKQRKYLSVSRQWEIDISYFDQVVEIVKETAPSYSLLVV